MFFFDPTFILVIIGILICLAASANVKITYNRYSKLKGQRGITAREAATWILRSAGITNVRVVEVKGHLSDHYDPRAGEIRLSESVSDSTSVAAIGVAAHECGHAIQHEKSYLPLKIRSVIIPVVNIGSTLSWPIILLGVIISSINLVHIGIILFASVLVFQLVTLPVEFNASKRAMRILRDGGILVGEELTGAKRVLTAAALTYVTAVLATVLQLLRLLLLFGNRRSRR